MNTPDNLFLPDQAELRSLLVELRQKHRALDNRIAAFEESAGLCQLDLRRLKKQKLLIKDQITEIEDKIIPDIIA